MEIIRMIRDGDNTSLDEQAQLVWNKLNTETE